MARVAPANNIYHPQISDDKDYDPKNDEDDEKMVQIAALALLDLHKTSHVIQKKQYKAIYINIAPKPRPGKSRYCRPSQQVMNKDEDPMCIDQPANETSDATKALMVYQGDTSLINQLNNNNRFIVAVEPKLLFSKKEREGILNIVKVEEDFIKVICACTSRKHGDYVGTLTVYRNGNLRIDCNCAPGCDLVDAKPEGFVSHARTRQGPGQWQRLIWIHVDYKKTKIKDTALLKFFNNARLNVENKKVMFKPHRDEFIKCSDCGVERRFKLRTVKECRAFHDAELTKNSWTCSMHPLAKMRNCDFEDERETRKVVRGCPRLGRCRGCRRCIFFGCHMCRFADCGCRACVDHLAANNN